MDKASVMPKGFWQRFVPKYWERLAVADPGPCEMPTSVEALFAMVLESDEGGRIPRRKFAIDGEQQDLKAHPEYLPQASDGSLDGYRKRIESLVGEREYTFTIDVFMVDDAMFGWTQRFLAELTEQTGHVSHGHFWTLFYGNYSTTPFGVHLDDGEAGFYFPLQGHKRMRTWRPDYVDRHRELRLTRDYSAHHEASTVVEADQGGVLYWPSDRWHVGDSRGGDTSIVLAVNCASDQFHTLVPFFHELTSGQLKGTIAGGLVLAHRQLKRWGLRRRPRGPSLADCSFALQDLQRQAAGPLPSELQEVIDVLRWVWPKQWLEKSMARVWLQVLTARGLKDPLIRPAAQSMPQLVHGSPQAPMLWRRCGDTQVLVAHKGKVLELAWHPQLPHVLKLLNSGTPQDVAHLRALLAAPQATDALDRLLQGGLVQPFATAPERTAERPMWEAVRYTPLEASNAARA